MGVFFEVDLGCLLCGGACVAISECLIITGYPGISVFLID